MSERIEVARIRTDGGCQPRATMLLDVVEDYANDMARGAEFPPVVVFYDGADYWLADGYHRRQAAEALGLVDILADVRQGTQRDAVLFSVGANAAHGMRRTNGDKRRSVMMLLNDPEWERWSDREIARKCNVSNAYVTNLRSAVTVNVNSERVYRSKHGTVSTMNTALIGSPMNDSRHDFRAKDEPPLPLGLDDEDGDENDEQENRLVFACRDCPEKFLVEVWHCHVCDYHWPRDKEYCGNCHDDRPELFSTARPNIDLSASHLWHALRDTIEAIKSLPAPAETAAKFPPILEHALRAEDVNAAAQWLAEFAELWAEGQAVRDGRTAEMVLKSKELRGNAAL